MSSSTPDSPGASHAAPRPNAEALYASLVASHAASVWRMALGLVGDEDDAEDLTQEVYYEAWRSIDRLRDPVAGLSWLFTILTRRASRRLRSVHRTPRSERGIDESFEAPVEGRSPLTVLQDRERIQQALDAVDPLRRQTFLLVIQGGFTCREAGEMLDVPLGTVLSRIHRVRAELRQALLGSGRAADRGAEDTASRAGGRA